MGRNGVLGEFGEHHALFGASLDFTDEAGDRAVKLFLLGERVAAAGAVGFRFVDGQRQEEVGLPLVAAHHRVEGVRLRAESVDQIRRGTWGRPSVVDPGPECFGKRGSGAVGFMARSTAATTLASEDSKRCPYRSTVVVIDSGPSRAWVTGSGTLPAICQVAWV
ncbi:hypothetical protein [Streptomyces kronopolitis]|uniref:hypothetical protein n=1 Tax=Streptomyces kronopolitis TaxID=1612435 RepID=UPI003415F80D